MTGYGGTVNNTESESRTAPEISKSRRHGRHGANSPRLSAAFFRAQSVFVLSAILAALLILASCGLPGNGGETTESAGISLIDVDKDNLDRQTLVRELVTCITDASKVENVFRSIPESQLDGLSLASFDGYIRALARMLPLSDSIKSYRFVTEAERNSVIGDIAANATDYSALLDATIPVELVYGNSAPTDLPIYIYIQEDANGTPFLSAAWVTECMKIYGVADLYFHALEAQDQNAVASLIEDGQVPEAGSFSPQVINYKAGELTKYYHIKVQSTYAEYRLISINLSQVTFLQPEVLDNDSLNFQSRTVRFIRNSQNRVAILDTVSTPLDSRSFYLYYNGKKAIRIGDRGDSNQFRSLFGEPVMVTLGVQTASDGNTADNEQVIVLTYSSASMTIVGNMYNDGSWDGRIIRIRLRSANQIFSLGTSITAGMTRDDLLMLYPFADQTDYTLETTVDDQKYEMTFSFSGDAERKVNGVKLEMIS